MSHDDALVQVGTDKPLARLLRRLMAVREDQQGQEGPEEDLEEGLPAPPTEDEIKETCARLRAERGHD